MIAVRRGEGGGWRLTCNSNNPVYVRAAPSAGAAPEELVLRRAMSTVLRGGETVFLGLIEPAQAAGWCRGPRLSTLEYNIASRHTMGTS